MLAHFSNIVNAKVYQPVGCQFVISALPEFSPSVATTVSLGRYYYSPHLTYEDPKVQRGEVTCHSYTAGKRQSQDSNPALPDAKICGTLDAQVSSSLYYTLSCI